MANQVKHVTAGTPKTSGALYHAVLNTKLPTDATSSLDAGFKPLGYVSDDGITQSEEIESNTVKAWGGDIVLVSQTGKTFTYQFTLIEALSDEVQKLVHGADNVTGTVDTGMTVKGNALELEYESFVIEQIMREDVIKRTVIPNGKVTSIGEVSYKDGEAVGYEVTITANPDSDGNSYYDYYSKATSISTVAND